MIAALAVALPWVIVALASWLAYQLVRHNGRVLLRLASLEAYLEAQQEQIDALQPETIPQGLPVGSKAPGFELQDLEGRPVALEQFLGRRVLLVFFDPACNFCRQMAPDLAALSPDGGEAGPAPLVVSKGDAETNRALAAEHGIRCPILLQEGREVAERYGAHGTPIGYLIDEKGRTAAPMASGAANLLALAKATHPAGNGAGPAAAASGASEGVSFAIPEREPRLRGGGLRPGTRAPYFRLPRLDGGSLSLEEYRGRRVLLVFSDPDCPACDQIVPELNRRYGHSPEVQIVIISRGDPQANREKLSRLGVTFPVALQREWEISRLYRKFATPVGYLINEQGAIMTRVAAGGDILVLAAKAARPHARKEVAPMRWRKFG